MSDIKKVDDGMLEATSSETPTAEETTASVKEVEVSAPETLEEVASEPAPVSEASTVDVEEPAVEEPVVEEPVAEEPAVEEPVAEEPVAEEPAVDDSSVDEASEIEEVSDEVDTDSKPDFIVYTSTAEVLNRMRELSESEEVASRQERDYLKSSFYRLQNQQSQDAHQKYLDEGGDPSEYVPPVNTDEPVFKELLKIINDKRAKNAEADKEEREANYQKKLSIIDKVKAILEKPDEVNKSYNEFRSLQQEWNEIKLVPADKATDLWKTFQHYVEQFYDTLKVSNALRAYDLKKNLELKTALCEKAEALSSEEDVVSAARKLQQLHMEYREIGPVEKDLREELWNRFKSASTVINRRHQEYFESRKAEESANLEKKTAICEQIESIDVESLKTFADWNSKTNEIISLQQEWRTIGFAPHKMNVKIFERFRAACDNFFSKKSEFIKNVHDSLQTNYEQKLSLCEEAESLKDSTDWKKTTDAFINLQKRWREIGTVPKKYSDEIWKRFNAACDAFFAAKKAVTSSQYSEQRDNLEKKKALIATLTAIVPEEESDLRVKLRELQDEWSSIGHVPFKDKESMYKAYREQMDRLYGALNESGIRNRVTRFKHETHESGVKEKLLRQREILTNEIKTYENNLGFLTFSSKSKAGSALVDDVNRKIEKLKGELEVVKGKLKALEEEE